MVIPIASQVLLMEAAQHNVGGVSQFNTLGPAILQAAGVTAVAAFVAVETYKDSPMGRRQIAATKHAAHELWQSARVASYATVGKNLMAHAVVGFSVPESGPLTDKAADLLRNASDDELLKSFKANAIIIKKEQQSLLERYYETAQRKDLEAKVVEMQNGNYLLSKEIGRRDLEFPDSISRSEPNLSVLEKKFSDPFVGRLVSLHSLPISQSLTWLSRDGFSLPPEGQLGHEYAKDIIKLAVDSELIKAIEQTAPHVRNLENIALANQTDAAFERLPEDIKSGSSAFNIRKNFVESFAKKPFSDRCKLSGTIGLSKKEFGKLVGLKAGLNVMRDEQEGREQLQASKNLARPFAAQLAAQLAHNGPSAAY